MLAPFVLAHLASAADVTLVTTTTVHTGDFRSSNTGESLCTASAAGTPFEGRTVLPLYSILGDSLAQRLQTTTGFEQLNRYVNYNGDTVANTFADLFSGMSFPNSLYNMAGGSAGYAWTGTKANGEHYESFSFGGTTYFYDCNGFTQTTDAINQLNGQYASSVRISDDYTSCTNSRPLLCAFLPAGGNGDPHFVGFNGARFNFDGTDGGVYNLITTAGFQLNTVITALDVNGHFGTWMGSLAIVSGSDSVVVNPRGVLVNDNKISSDFFTANSTVSVTGIATDSNGRLSAVKIETTMAELSITVVHTQNGEAYLNFDVALFLAQGTPVHGVLGQTASPLSDASHFTIEGADDDYLVRDGIFGSEFAFNLFRPNEQTPRTRSAAEPIIASTL